MKCITQHTKNNPNPQGNQISLSRAFIAWQFEIVYLLTKPHDFILPIYRRLGTKTVVTQSLMHWSYCNHALNHRYCICSSNLISSFSFWWIHKTGFGFQSHFSTLTIYTILKECIILYMNNKNNSPRCEILTLKWTSTIKCPIHLTCFSLAAFFVSMLRCIWPAIDYIK